MGESEVPPIHGRGTLWANHQCQLAYNPKAHSRVNIYL